MHYLVAFLLAELALAAPAALERKSSPLSSRLSRSAPSLKKRQNWQSWSNPGESTTGYSGHLVETGNLFTTIEVEGQSFQVVLDSGSSDTWIAQTGFHCWNTGNHTTRVFSGTPTSDHLCEYGNLYTPGAGFEPVTNFTQYSCYGQGNEGTERCVGGEFGKVTVNVNGLEIPHTIVGAPLNSSAYSTGEPNFSGILGMAFPNITSGVSEAGKKVNYPSVLQNAFYDENLGLEKKWSLAVSRDESNTGDAGVFTIGGIPDLNDPSINATSGWVSVPFELVPNRTQLQLYIATVDGFSFGEQTAAGLPVIFDSGSPGVEVPKALATSVNNQWTPAANVTADGVIVDCTATLPAPVGITIGATTFFIEDKDLLLPGSGFGLTDGQCISGLMPGVGLQYIMGTSFFANALAVFDWEESQLTLYPRQYYKS